MWFGKTGKTLEKAFYCLNETKIFIATVVFRSRLDNRMAQNVVDPQDYKIAVIGGHLV